MTDVYSPVLAAGLAFIVGTALCLLSSRVSHSAHLRRLAQIGAVLSLITLLVGVWSHVAIGHRPGSDRALAPIQFLLEHPMAAVASVAAIVLLLASRRRDP